MWLPTTNMHLNIRKGSHRLAGIKSWVWIPEQDNAGSGMSRQWHWIGKAMAMGCQWNWLTWQWHGNGMTREWQWHGNELARRTQEQQLCRLYNSVPTLNNVFIERRWAEGVIYTFRMWPRNRLCAGSNSNAWSAERTRVTWTFNSVAVNISTVWKYLNPTSLMICGTSSGPRH